jgi:type IV pilus assembly protein PilN
MPEINMPIGVNLLPWREQRAQRQTRHLILTLAATAGIGLMIMWAASLAMTPAQDKQAEENAELSVKLKQRVAQKNQRIALEKKRSALTQRTQVIRNLTANSHNTLTGLSTIASALPSSITLTRVEQTDAVITIDGTTAEPQTLPIYLTRLRGKSGFADVSLRRLSADDSAQTRQRAFQITAERRGAAR